LDQKTKEIVERLRASIGDSFTPDPRFDDCQEAASLIESLSERVGELERGLGEALDGWQEGAEYKGEYLKAKHGDAEEIAKWRALLSKQEERG
jgi:hypothetical protein